MNCRGRVHCPAGRRAPCASRRWLHAAPRARPAAPPAPPAAAAAGPALPGMARRRARPAGGRE
ncbi:hypothetical protein F1189_11500 [Rhodovastum atsumiense]|uniref:Uncharacterized protein n=1 Tax=Rhodovastum atsumiense TaxID=504468 RepID=A0A5M6IXH5_9PROT|nr:hypothetical protein F1189_11500 [Rhodovastum atsumiense]